jgi:hypothetical protein
MVVSRDWQEVSVLECILGGMQIGVEVEPEPKRAQGRLAVSKVDALIVDFDLEGSGDVLRGMHNAPMQTSVPLIMVGPYTKRHNIPARDGSFIFEKPISVEAAVHTLSAARNLILEGRLRYHRESLQARVKLSCAGKRLSAQLMNLSQGGAGIRVKSAEALNGPVRVDLALPGSKSPLQVKGEVAWTDDEGHAGIRFLEIGEMAKKDLQLWMERRYFTA